MLNGVKVKLKKLKKLINIPAKKMFKKSATGINPAISSDIWHHTIVGWLK